MRIFCLFFFFLFIPNGIAQNNFKFDESNYETLIQKSKETQKPIFLMLYATWCPHCAKMENEVLKDTTVTNLLSKNYICAWQDIDKEEGIVLNKKYNITSLPTFIFLDSNENELYRLKGEYKTQTFISEIQNAMNPKQQLPYLDKIFMEDPSNTNKWLNYMNVLKKGRDRINLSEKANSYLKTQTDEQLISENNWKIIANCVTAIPSREFQYVLQHQKEFEAISSPLRVERKIINIVSELLNPFTETLDTINYYKQRKIAQTIHSQKVDSLIFRYDLTIAERTNNWGNYQKTTIESTEKLAWNDANLLKEISQNYLKNISDIPSLKYAIKWTIHSLELQDSFDGNLLLSNLYLKIKDKKSAIEMARKAKAICTSLKFNPKTIDELYLKLGIK
ncbi:MAG: thioredoxin family protein [Flavobacterium sp.]|uniref:thioredoxin family protein n=1 Tax=Flavobacterium sp. TaxID=239 RepID=UPI00262C5B40|nr:thioredoxin family protein [Flavobacterium sp.]MDD5150516.1 thioredoxin family protein [Flavobacterium sp.]